MPHTIAIIEDHQETRDLLVSLIEAGGDFQCIGWYEKAETAVEGLPKLRPEVVLVDIHLPGQSGIQCVRNLRPQLPDTLFLMCTSLENPETIFQALQAGACGYLTKSSGIQSITAAILDALNGGAPMSSSIARKVVSYFHQPRFQEMEKELEKLSHREQEILEYLAKGYRYKEIAALLYISIETVRKHIHNIYYKLQVNSRTDAINKVQGRNI